MPASASVPRCDTHQVSISPVEACASITSTFGHAMRSSVGRIGALQQPAGTWVGRRPARQRRRRVRRERPRRRSRTRLRPPGRCRRDSGLARLAPGQVGRQREPGRRCARRQRPLVGQRRNRHRLASVEADEGGIDEIVGLHHALRQQCVDILAGALPNSPSGWPLAAPPARARRCWPEPGRASAKG